MPQLDITFYSAQIFWLVISFGILFFAMKFWLLPPLEDILQKREDKIKKILRQADSLSFEAERISMEYQKYIDDATQYSVRVLQTAHDEIAVDYAVQEEELLQRLKTDTQKAEEDVFIEQKNVLNDLENITVNFTKIFLKVLYSLKTAEKTLKKSVSILIKGKKNV